MPPEVCTRLIYHQEGARHIGWWSSRKSPSSNIWFNTNRENVHIGLWSSRKSPSYNMCIDSNM